MLVKLKYTKVGIDKFSGIIEHQVEPSKAFDPDYIAELAYYDVKNKKCCASKHIETSYCLDTNQGFVSAGMRTVGTFEWLTSEDRK
ncbi:MAG: hypothetical protein M0R49_13115 [Limnochordia bacterium]|nr:hypothetical protein [Limnochordia bacterium]